jgi:hypothetical protein
MTPAGKYHTSMINVCSLLSLLNEILARRRYGDVARTALLFRD